MRTFEFDDGKSRKFWNIALNGSEFTVTFGKIGTKGQTQTKSFADAATAQKEHDKLVAGKLKKSYTETTVAGSTPLRAALETALIENPDDVASHMAYADHLHDQGDPRGEFIQVQLALEDPALGAAARKKHQDRERELLVAHEREWLGPMGSFFLDQDISGWAQEYGIYHQHTWRRGWIDSLRIQYLGDETVAAVLAQQHLLKLLSELKVMNRNRDDDDPLYEALMTGDFYAHVRVFQLGPDNDACFTSGRFLLPFLDRMPRLRELHLYAHHVDVETLFQRDLSRLHKLTVHHLHGYPLELLAANRTTTHLTHLSFWPHAQEPGENDAYITSAAAQTLFRSPHLENLTHLQMRNSDTGDEGITTLIESGLLKRLKTLDLYGGCVTDAGALALAACPDLRHLESLQIGSNMIGAAGQAALQATGVRTDLGYQYDPASRYLCFEQGDME